MDAKLIQNVQFIYELALAQMELESFGVSFSVKDGLREFVLSDSAPQEQLIKRSAYLSEIDEQETDYQRIIRYNRTRSVNQYLTHWIYPYKGKFHPQMIRSLLNIIKLKEGDTVLDNFVGSGTTAVEAQLLGIHCIGLDISPLCVLQSKVKTRSYNVVEQIASLREEAIDYFRSTNHNSEQLNLFSTSSKTYGSFLDGIHSEDTRNFYKMAELVAVSDYTRRRRKLQEAFTRNLDLMIASVTDFKVVSKELGLHLSQVTIEEGDARKLNLPDESVNGIITSPPYSIALDYVKNDEHALLTLGCDVKKSKEKCIGVRGAGKKRVELYNKDMAECLKDMHRVLKSDRYCVIVIGNATYQGNEVNTIEFVIDQCEAIGLKLEKNINKIIFGLYNVMQTENTLIFKKVN